MPLTNVWTRDAHGEWVRTDAEKTDRNYRYTVSADSHMFAYGLACSFVLLYGYNRIHMTNHFLSNVCFGTLITCLIFAAVSYAFLRTVDHGNGKD